MPGGRILVVEDEPVVARDHCERLEALGYAVAGTAASASEALERAGAMRPDLALVDIRLRGDGDGITAAAELRRRFGVPTIFITAYADDGTLERARHTGPLGYLVKPFQDRELQATIEMGLQRHRAEVALRASEERLRTLVELAPDAIVLAGMDGLVSLSNRAAGSVLAPAPGGAPTDGLLGLLDRGGDGGSRIFLEELAGRGSVRDRLVKVGSPDGSVRWMELNASLLRNGSGGAPEILAVLRDVTARKEAESGLRRLSAAVRLAREIIIMTDSAGKVVFANEAAITGLGLERGAVPGLDFLAVLVPGEREKGRLALREAARSGELPGIDLWMRRQNGETFPVELSAAALGEEGDGACIVTISRDMSDKRRAERELRSRLMAYMLEEGNVYLVKETAPSLSQAAYEDLLAAGFRGAVLSRTPPEKAPLPAGQPAERKWLAERPGDNVVSPRADAIERWVAGLPRNRAVLVDRLDYVISKNGFRSALHLVHRLRELAFLMGHAMILSIDPATVAERDLRALEKEAREVLPRTRPDLPRDELEALRFVFERELSGTRPSLSDLGRGLGLSKPTARKRVRDLARYGYLVVGNRGRSKLLELTESGRRLFSGN